MTHLQPAGATKYDPALRRFTTADPYVTEPLNPQGLNRYSYVQNNPMSFTDPSGFAPEDEAAIQAYFAQQAAQAQAQAQAMAQAQSQAMAMAAAQAAAIGNQQEQAQAEAMQAAMTDAASQAAMAEGLARGEAIADQASARAGEQAQAQHMIMNDVTRLQDVAFREPYTGPVPGPTTGNGLYYGPPMVRDTSHWVAGDGTGGPGTPYLPDPNQKPPGWTPDWPEGVDNRGPYSQDPNGTKWYPHHENEGHWPHYDKEGGGRFPENSVKPWPEQKQKPYGPQSATDPWKMTPAQQAAATISWTGVGIILLVILLSPVGA